MSTSRAVKVFLVILLINVVLVVGYFSMRFASIQEDELRVARREKRTDIIGVGIVDPKTMRRIAILSSGEGTMDTVYFDSVNQRTKEAHITKVGNGKVIYVDIGFVEWFFSEIHYPNLAPTPMTIRPVWFASLVPVLTICVLTIAVLKRKHP